VPTSTPDPDDLMAAWLTGPTPISSRLARTLQIITEGEFRRVILCE
jgi:hypothetical protein